MDKTTRAAIEKATQRARKLLEDDFAEQLEGTYDVLLSGQVAPSGGAHLTPRQRLLRGKIVAAVEHKRAASMKSAEAVADYLRDAAFTTLNRFVALKMLEARDLVQDCISKGDQSNGYREFCGLAPGVPLLPDGAGYRLYLECILDELSTEVKVLFDRRDLASALWPSRATMESLLEVLNGVELTDVWREDETIGWVYQYFNSQDERRKMRESQAPQTSRALAIRNQFFTPRYVVEFLVQNTIGALWVEMTCGGTRLKTELPLLIPRDVSSPRPRKDPRDIRVLDPACGSGHFLLYAFDVLATIYEEAWAQHTTIPWQHTGRTIRQDFPERNQFLLELPRLIIENNLYGIDIDDRCAQIAALALWMRAQRAWKDLELAPVKRPRIQRTNIVIAEPIPTGPETREAFIRQLDPRLGSIVDALFRRLDLAGEAGSLLEINEWFRSEIRTTIGGYGALFAASDEDRWRDVESQLLRKLKEFAADALQNRQWGRSLFASDAMRGIAFVDAIREKYDVVLMNPPFGDPTAKARTACGNELRIAANDLGGAFALAAKQRWAPHGCIGLLSSTTLWFKPTVSDWRLETLLSDEYAMRAAAHLGGDVLDGATVSASATIVDQRVAWENAAFFRLLMVEDKASRLAEAISELCHCRQDPLVFTVPPEEFRSFRSTPLAYWISKGLRARLTSFPALEGNGAEVRQGVATADDFRFVRAWWEVPCDTIGLSKQWAPFAKSSEYSPLWDDITWVIRWNEDGREVRAFERSYPRSTTYFGRAGVTYPARAVLGFNPRAFPRDAAFGHMGSVAFPLKVDERALLGYLASRPLEYVLSFSNGSLQGKKGAYPNHYEVGQIKDLPWPSWSPESLAVLTRQGDVQATAAMNLQTDDETTHQYTGRPGLSGAESVRQAVKSTVRRRAALVAEAVSAREEVDRVVAAELGFNAGDIAVMDAEFACCESPATGPWSSKFGEASDEIFREEAEHLASELFGFAIGRFDIRPAISGAARTDRSSAFDPLPLSAPAALRNPPPGYSLSAPHGGLLIIDRGSPLDVGRALTAVTNVLWPGRSARLGEELAELLGFEELREYFAASGQNSFFDRHLAHYSKSRRTAPIYWNIATSSGNYAAFLHYRELRRDTLFILQHDHLEPKLHHEVRELAAARRDAGPNPAANQRKALALKEVFVEELRAFLDEVKRVAPLWNPHLDDGVIINFAPLWRLVPHHKPWQKELKATWDALCAGEYDWAHLAMHLWPERVVPKCATDRSLAIAHGLEDAFWIEGEDGKWKPRPQPTQPVEELVREHTSPAVKTALQSLLEAPVSPAGNGRGRARRGRSAAGAPA